MTKEKTGELENHSIMLDSLNVKYAENIFNRYGGKLSPFMNSLLDKWVKEQKEILEDK